MHQEVRNTKHNQNRKFLRLKTLAALTSEEIKRRKYELAKHEGIIKKEISSLITQMQPAEKKVTKDTKTNQNGTTKSQSRCAECSNALRKREKQVRKENTKDTAAFSEEVGGTKPGRKRERQYRRAF